MKLLIDSNVILDILTKREPHFENSYLALKKAIEAENTCFVSASAITDIYYILNRQLKSSSVTKDKIANLLEIVDVADVTSKNIDDALDSDMNDFEDAVVCQVANSYDIDIILTRNIKDFTGCDIKSCKPADF